MLYRSTIPATVDENLEELANNLIAVEPSGADVFVLGALIMGDDPTCCDYGRGIRYRSLLRQRVQS